MFRKVKCIISLSLILIFVFSFASTQALVEQYSDIELNNLLDNMFILKLEENNIPNATVVVVKDNEIIYKKGFGYKDIENKIPVDADTTMFRIGSTSKLITWTAVMQLVEAGKLDLETDINTYLDFEVPSRLLGPLNKGTVQAITLTHLMTHTAGFEDYPDMLFRIKSEELLPFNEYIKNYLPKRIFPAGEVAAYSNYGTALAGYIVERVSGEPFKEYVDKNIFQPLGMSKSSFQQPLNSDLSSLIAKPYRFINDRFEEGSFEYIIPEPAGSMSSTALDMARFMIAHLNGGAYNGQRILEEATSKKMHKQQFSYNSDLGGMALGFIEGQFNNNNVIFHSGGTMLYSTGLYLLPNEKIGIFISYSGGNHLVHSEIFQEFMDYYYPEKAALKVTPYDESRERGLKFRGEYHMNRKSLTTEEKSISLLIGTIKVDIDEEGYLLVTHLGETNKFVEIEPGVYQNLRDGRTQDYFGPFNKIVFKTDPYGRIMITTDGPMTYSRAPFYATLNFTILALLIMLSILLISFLYWIIIGITGMFTKRSRYPQAVIATRWISIIFSIAIILLLTGLLATGDIDPIYQLPKSAYMQMEANAFSLYLPKALLFISLMLFASTVIIWRNRIGNIFGRIHYTTYSLVAFGLMLLFNYWNIV